MGWSKMGEEMNLFYIDDTKFPNEIKKFDKEYVEGKSAKFIQLYAYNKPILISATNLYHKTILNTYLIQNGLKFNTRLNPSKEEIPLEEGENYKLVGTGRVKCIMDCLSFYDSSMDYYAKAPGPNKIHLEEIFGKENVKAHKDVSILVKFDSLSTPQ